MSAQKLNLFNKILFPTDGSIHSLHAAKYVAELAKNYGSKITLLHILEISTGDDPIEIYEDSWIAPLWKEKVIKERGKKVIETTKEILNEYGISYKTKVFIHGHPSETIIEIAEKDEVDLIVMGSHGLSGIKRFMLGSVADRVSHYAPCPVLIVR